MAIASKYANLDFKSSDDFLKNFKVNVPDNFNFGFDVVDEIANITPDKTALVWCDGNNQDARFTFNDIKLYSNKTANFLSREGIKKGDKVMLILKNHYEFWWIIIALHKIGAVVIPATHLLTKKDVVYRNNAANIKMIISTATSSELMDNIDIAHSDSPVLEKKVFVGKTASARDGWMDFYKEIEPMSDVFERPTGENATQNEDIMLLYFTSGTTGQPKMVVHDYTYPLGHITTAAYWQNVEDNGLHLTVADTGWAKTAWGKIYGQWLCETAVFAYDYSNKFDPTDLLEIIQKYRITTFCAPPTIYRFLIKADLYKYDLSSLKHCCIAGEPLNPEIYNQFYATTGLKLTEGFGQTETTVAIFTNKFINPKPGSMGMPSPMYNIDIVDDAGNSVDAGQEGNVVIKVGKGKGTLGLFKGYYLDEERIKTAWDDGIYYTGDLAWKDEEGYYWYVGRSDDIIKSSGYRIGPFEVESALLEHPSVLETAITAVPDEIRGQVVKATIVLAKGYTPSEELKVELQNYVKKVTAPYKYPRIIEFVDSLPKTISGKIRRVDIRNEDKK